jgi:hypothetical protein
MQIYYDFLKEKVLPDSNLTLEKDMYKKVLIKNYKNFFIHLLVEIERINYLLEILKLERNKQVIILNTINSKVLKNGILSLKDYNKLETAINKITYEIGIKRINLEFSKLDFLYLKTYKTNFYEFHEKNISKKLDFLNYRKNNFEFRKTKNKQIFNKPLTFKKMRQKLLGVSYEDSDN